jgi:hypothetical protein
MSEVERADHVTRTTEMTRIAIEIRERKGVKVRAIFTDNAKILVQALDEKETDGTMQRLTNTPAVHIRCGIHSAQLGLTDFKKEGPVFKVCQSNERAIRVAATKERSRRIPEERRYG